MWKNVRSAAVSALSLLLASCSSKATAPAKVTSAPQFEIELVESVPLETTLDHADIRDAAAVWPEMIDRATRTIDFEEFYASDVDSGPSALTPTLTAIDRAVKRGVKIRFLADSVMAPKYPATLDRLRSSGVTIAILDVKPRYGGVQHAKFMVVDGVESFVGSQNFDYRALSHIQEMGVRVRSPETAGALEDIFDTDWKLSDPKMPSTTRVHHHPVPPTLFASPEDWLPETSSADLPHLVSLLAGAKSSIDLQVLTYSTTMRDKTEWKTLDDAIRAAAARGVHVRMLISSWGAKAKSHELASIEALVGIPNIEVRIFTIPPWSGGDVPFARVSHAKFLVLDRAQAWIGTSNWEGDYFLKTRNVAIVTDAKEVVPKLVTVFDGDWTSNYAKPLAKE